jgi:hypothetical protein
LTLSLVDLKINLSLISSTTYFNSLSAPNDNVLSQDVTILLESLFKVIESCKVALLKSIFLISSSGSLVSIAFLTLTILYLLNILGYL